MANSKFRLYTFLDLSISIIGLTLCVLTTYWIYQGIPFEFLMFSGTLGAIMTVLGTSLFVDLLRFKAKYATKKDIFLFH